MNVSKELKRIAASLKKLAADEDLKKLLGEEFKLHITFDESWIDENDEVDYETGTEDEYQATVLEAMKAIHDNYAYEASDSHFSGGHTWYTTSGDEDYRTGKTKRLSFHVNKASQAAQKLIWDFHKLMNKDYRGAAHQLSEWEDLLDEE